MKNSRKCGVCRSVPGGNLRLIHDVPAGMRVVQDRQTDPLIMISQ
ncbi:MAG TPA: hypothetical protein PKM41_09015 [Deltaproteobacteria bacterium]|jgi:hypothetical protein|nr:hypothetical protein [Deltaproteobacteria bacterium]HOI07418.1 hypothetical protein [Deltaproteobacteria bacterium]